MKSNKAIRRKERRSRRHVQVLEKNYAVMKAMLRAEKERADLAIEAQLRQQEITNEVLCSHMVVTTHPDHEDNPQQIAVDFKYTRPDQAFPLRIVANLSRCINYEIAPITADIPDRVQVRQFMIGVRHVLSREMVYRYRDTDWLDRIIRDVSEELATFIVAKLLSDSAMQHFLKRKAR